MKLQRRNFDVRYGQSDCVSRATATGGMVAGARLRIPRTGGNGGLGNSARISRLGNVLRGTGGCCPAFVQIMDSRSETNRVRRLRRPVKSYLDQRQATAWNAEIHTRSGPVPCIVEDVSVDGAKVRVGCVPIDGDDVTLIIPNYSPITARIVWRRRKCIGVQFSTSQPLDNRAGAARC
jgi:hypothetical protein